MSGALGGLAERIKPWASGFAMYSALGSFVLYLLGYLSLRFHLTFIGVATDMAVLDERYLFAGANCLVYLASSFPIAVLVAAVLAAIAYVPYRLLPSAARDAAGRGLQRFLASPVAPSALGILLSVALIQIWMRKCFVYANVLVKESLPPDAPWLNGLLSNERYMPLYFSGLILGTAVTGALLLRSPAAGQGDAGAPAAGNGPLRGLLGALVVIQILLLPVNFGVLVFSKSLPRVTTVGKRALGPGEQAWLAWDGKSSVSFLVKRPRGERSLVTVSHDAMKDAEMEITGYDGLTKLLPEKPLAREDLHAADDK